MSFSILTKAPAGSPPFKPETRQGIIRAGLHELAWLLRDLPVVWPELTTVQRAQIQLEIGEAVTLIHNAERACEAVLNVVEAELARRIDSAEAAEAHRA